MEARANAACLRCSGNFDSFYNVAKNAIFASEDTCIQILGNCTDVFAFNAEVNTFYRRIEQLKKGMGGEIYQSNDEGMSWKEIKQLQVCSSDFKACKLDEKLLLDTCWHVSVAASNPNVEGDINVWLEGLQTLKALVLERDVKDVKRVLTADSLKEFDDSIRILSKLVSKRQRRDLIAQKY